MSFFENVEIPFVRSGNQRGITREQRERFPFVDEFIQRFQHCFKYDVNRQIFLYIEHSDDTTKLELGE